MEKMHIIFDVDKCVGCFNCMLACQDEHCGNEWLPYTGSMQLHDEKWIHTTRHERGKTPIIDVCFQTEMCHHCENAYCEKKFPDAIYHRKDGIVLIDPEKAANKDLVKACPYGMISWNEEKGAAQKCTLCAHLLDDGWEEPRCVQACPLRALSVVKCSDEEYEGMVAKHKLKKAGSPESGSRLAYKNMYRINSVFVFGAVVEEKDGIERCVEGAKAQLILNGDVIAEADTDFFGEYRIDSLPKNAGAFELKICKDGYKEAVLNVTIENECCDAGKVQLEADL